MPKNILVPVDGSCFAGQAVAWAAGAARRSGALLHIVQVRLVTSAPTSSVLRPAAQGPEECHLTSLAAAARATGVVVRTAVSDGAVIEALAGYTAKNSIDQIVMTTHGRGGLSRAWLGSVADGLIRRVDVPVLLLRPRAAVEHGLSFEAQHIMLPVDGSEWSERVVEHAVALGSLTGARYSLVHVAAPPLDSRDGITHAGTGMEEFRLDAVLSLERLADGLRARGLMVHTAVVLQSQAALGILEYALENRVDVIAMATHSRHGITRFLLGSVADKVMRSSHVPLLMLPPEHAGTAQPVLSYARASST